MSAIDGLKKGINSILAVRDKIGILHEVFIVTRTWSGGDVGRGEKSDRTHKVVPTPGIKAFSQDVRITEASAVQQGDIILRGISKVNYPLESDVDCSSTAKGVEKFFLIADKEYQVKNVTESYVTWDVQLRLRSGKVKNG